MADDGKDDDWSSILDDHPIFSPQKSLGRLGDDADLSLELSTNTLSKFRDYDPRNDNKAPSGRRQIMVLKNEDLIVASGNELRMTSLGDSKLGRSTRKSYKVRQFSILSSSFVNLTELCQVLHTPNLQFQIHQLALNPNGKLLAIAGATQVAVVVLPRAGYSRLVPSAIDCK